jgi:hypothetical protein
MSNKNYLKIDFENNFKQKEIDVFKDKCYEIIHDHIGEIGNLIKKDEDAKLVYFHFIFLLSKYLADAIYPCDKVKFIESLSEQLLEKKLCDNLVEQIKMDNAIIKRV